MKTTSFRRFCEVAVFSGLLVVIIGCTGCPPVATNAIFDAALGAERSFPVVDTGQEYSYDEAGATASPAVGAPFHGQDAQYVGNLPNYTDNGDGTITDNVTGLTWQKTPGAKLTYADAVTGASSLALAGYSDWRLPTIKELYSLMLFSGDDPSGPAADPNNLTPFIDTNYFDFAYGNENAGERLIDAQYWSSTEYVGTTMNAEATVFGVNFADGRIKGYPRDRGPMGGPMREFVRYVRGNATYGVNNFVDNGDGTITDQATGLTWMQNDSGAGLDWHDALAYAENLEHAGHDDWRLPNAKELQSIVDYTRSPQTTGTAAIDPLFNVTLITDEGGLNNAPCYWTSTTHANLSQYPGYFAVYVAFGEALGWMQPPMGGTPTLMDVHGAGAQRSDPKFGDPADWPYGNGPQGDVVRIYNFARCVRGGAFAVPGSTPPNGDGHPQPPEGVTPPNDGGDYPQPPEGDRPPAFEELDGDGDGQLSLDEALSIPNMTEERFNNLDANGNGYLSQDELPPPPHDGDSNDGDDHPRPPEGEGPPAFEYLDIDSDGQLSLDEALAIPHMTEERFNELDADGNGYLSQDELPAPPTGDGDDHPRPPESEGPPTFEYLDIDGDGQLSLDEALAIPHMTEERFNELDADGNGYLSQDELPAPPPHDGDGDDHPRPPEGERPPRS